MSEILFKCPCPARGCLDMETRGWYHTDCPSNSNYYISDEGILRCEHCGKKVDFFNCTWKSNSCSHDYKKSDIQRVIFIFSHMNSRENVPRSFFKKLICSLIEQAEKYDAD